MEKLELYHFHKKGNQDKKWDVNKTIDVTKDFNSTTYKRFQDFTTAVELDGQKINFEILLAKVLHNNDIRDLEKVKELLMASYSISFYASEFKRENALENYRLNNTPNLPSRLHSVYLTDEKGIEAWKKKFGNAELDLYRVEAEGNIFKTNE